MSRDAKIDLDWADGHYDFRLAWKQLIELQEKCEAGPFVIEERLATRRWLVQDISQVLRLGLIGGGLEPAKAFKLVQDYVESRPPLENVMFARAVLLAAIQGAPDEKPGEHKGEATGSASMPSPTESSE